MGLAALPQVVLPEMYGSSRQGSCRIVAGILSESSAGAYAGLLATLFVAPLAWCRRKQRSICVLAVVLGVAGLSWSLNVPILVQLLRMPGLNLMSHNRFVFLTAFAILILTAAGLNSLWQGKIPQRQWFLVPLQLLAVLSAWCIFRTAVLPERLAIQLPAMVLQAEATTRIHDMAGVLEVQHTFRRYYAITAALAALGSAGWWWLWIRATIPRWAFALLGTLTVGELLWFGYGRAAQTDPALYYPRIPVLEQLATAPPGRIIGFNCLPANLAQTHGLHDVRGYDGVDPAQWVNLLKAAADPKSYMPRYALTQWLSPKGEVLPSGRLVYSPILSMLDVRYIVLRGRPAQVSALRFRMWITSSWRTGKRCRGSSYRNVSRRSRIKRSGSAGSPPSTSIPARSPTWKGPWACPPCARAQPQSSRRPPSA